jgi:hypothetical protein
MARVVALRLLGAIWMAFAVLMNGGGASKSAYSAHDFMEYSPCKDSPKEYKRIYGERPVGAFSWKQNRRMESSLERN